MNGFMSLLDLGAQALEAAFVLMAQAAIAGALLGAVVLAADLLFHKWLSVRQRSILWGIVLLRLLVPVAPGSPLSLQSVLPIATDPDTHGYLVRTVGDTWPADSAPLDAIFENPVSQFTVSAGVDAHAVTIDSAIDVVFRITPLVWLLGAIVVLVGTAGLHWLFCRRLKRIPQCDDQRLTELWQSCCEAAGVSKSIPIIQLSMPPAISGWISPCLLLPVYACELSDEQLRMIMFHELAHVRRCDVVMNWMLTLIRALHWWNPVYWIAATRIHNLREQACDAYAIECAGGEAERAYRNLLLMLAERQADLHWRIAIPSSMVGFFSSFRMRAVHRRLEALHRTKIAHGRGHAVAVGLLIALLSVCGLTDAQSNDAPPQPSRPLPIIANQDWRTWQPAPVERGPNQVRIYDVQKVFEQILAEGESREAAETILRSTLDTVARSLAAIDAKPVPAPRVTAYGKDEPMHASRNGETDEPGPRFEFQGASLIARAPLEVHAELASVLKAWQETGLGQVSIGVRLISGEEEFTSAMGLSWRNLQAFSDSGDDEVALQASGDKPVLRGRMAVDEYLPMAVAILDDKQTAELVSAIQRRGTSMFVQGPKITLFNGQRGSLRDCSSRPFVVGIEKVESETRRPTLAILDEGTKISLRATQSSDLKKVQLEGRIELSQIEDVGKISSRVDDELATIQVPRVRRCRIDVASEVPDGHSLLIGCMPAHEPRQYFYVLLTVRNLVLE